MSCIEPAKAMISATSANINKLFVGSIKEINISDIKIIICINNIQLLLEPMMLSTGIENLSTKGAHKNFNE